MDVDRKLVTVGAGATVNKVLQELRKHGLTLQNFSSIQEQQIGGWTQVAAHGTGCTLPTVDEMIQKMTIVSPVCGPLTLSRVDCSRSSSGSGNSGSGSGRSCETNSINNRLFDMARVGLVSYFGSFVLLSERLVLC